MNKLGIQQQSKSRFDQSNYNFRKIIIDVYLQSLGMEVRKLVEDGYGFPKAANESKENGKISTSRMTIVDQ